MSKVTILMHFACGILAVVSGMTGPVASPAGGAEKEYYGMPVYVESRSLPELPKRPSQVRDDGIPKGKRLRAGAARVDVTPDGTVTMRGFQARQSTGIHDRLYVRALVLDNGEDSLAILSWDKLELYGFEKIAEIRHEIQQRTGIPVRNILINATHTHSGCEGKFHEASVEAVSQAWESRKGARIGIGSKMIYGIGSNRRRPDGTGLWKCNQPNPEAVMDNECGVIRVENAQRNLLAVLVNYSSHPTVLDGRNTLLSGDYAGIATAEIEKRQGQGVVALFLQGCAGDTGTHTFRKSRTIPEAEKLGRRLANEVLEIVPHIDVSSWVQLGGGTRMIGLPQKQLDTTKPETVPPIVEGKSIQNEIQALFIGDALILAVGSMEAYVRIGLDIKKASPFPHTFALAFSNGPWLGYLPSPHGYAVSDPDARQTPFSSQAPHTLVKEALRLGGEMKQKCMRGSPASQ